MTDQQIAEQIVEAECGMFLPIGSTESLITAIARALTEARDGLQGDIEAYRGALGYSVPGSRDGRLSNGETPRCGLCGGRDNRIAALTAAHERAKRLIIAWRDQDTWAMPAYGTCADELEAAVASLEDSKP